MHITTWLGHARAALLCALFATVGGCTAQPAPEPDAATPDVATDAPPIPAVDPVPATLPEVVARVNGTAITGSDLERAIRAAERQAGQPVPPQFRDQIYRRVLDRLVDFHLLLQEASTRGLVVDNAEVDAEIARIRESYPSAEAFDTQLRDWDSSIDTLREETRKDLSVAKAIEQELVPAVALDEANIRAFYDQHQDQFIGPESMDARHILIGAAPDAEPAARAAARAEADAIRQQAVAPGGDFAALARAHSTDETTASSGGDLGMVQRGQTVPPFEQALFALDPGGVSNVVESPFGFHIIQAGARHPGAVLPFERAQHQIRAVLVEQERAVLMDAFLGRLRVTGAVEILI